LVEEAITVRDVEVVDRGSHEIVVFLRGDIDDGMEHDLRAALRAIALLEEINDLDRVVVDARQVTSMGRAGLCFLLNLERQGQGAYEVDLSALSRPVLRALERSHWHHLPVEA
jgi:anti-anti-sigma factor